MAMSPRLLRPRANSRLDPKSIAGLVGWWDAADSTTLFDASSGGSLVAADGAVGRWQDKSGAEQHIIQNTANNRPLRKASAVNGRDAVRFDGSNDFFSSQTTVVYAQPRTILCAVSHADVSGGQSNIFDSNSARHVIFKSGSSGFIGLFAGGSSISSSSAVLVSNRACVISAVVNSASSILRGNRSQVASGNPGTSSFNGILRVGVGSVASEYWNGDILELLFYSSQLSVSQISAVENYLAQKWGAT